MLYFDHSATTQPYPEVMQTAQQVAMEYYANPSSAHPAGEASRKLMEQARLQMSQILCFKSHELFFASSGTEVNNWVLQAIVEQQKAIHPNKNTILISSVEHPSISNQIPSLKAQGFNVVLLNVDAFGRIKVDELAEQLNDNVLLLSTIAVNNEVGTIQPLADIENLLKKYPQIIWHVDAVQAITTQLDLIKRPRIDLLTLSSHKYHGIRGLGILAKRQRVENGIFIYGGGQESGLRSGTENLPAIVAGAKALRMAAEKQVPTKEKLKAFKEAIVQQFKDFGWQVFGYPYTSEHIVSAALPSIPGEVILNAFAEAGILISTSSACSSRRQTNHHTLKAMQVTDSVSKSAIRISLSDLNTKEELQQLLTAIADVTKKLQINK
ncbi:cysteine desulfurase family protein [Fundicoccus sp. Sow4_H7]|uniref:cysteine desulfurase family protein n=1 Tax=Fundicoccus sp. Sow4_H7 TaxID=3438784 RepID=UPI003F8ECA16